MTQVKIKLSVILWLILQIFILSCNRDKEQFIDKELEIYVDSFFIDANARGLNIKKEDFDLTVQLVNVESSDGECHFHKNLINIDKKQWQNFNFADKKWLLYHELGHCILERRDHKNEISNNGQCISIMRGKENGFRCLLNLHSSIWWQYYLDELFYENTSFPFWDKSIEKYDVSKDPKFELNIDTITNFIEGMEIDSSLFLKSSKISVSLSNLSNSDNLFKIYFDNLGFSYCSKCVGVNIRINNDLFNHTYYEHFDTEILNNDRIKLSLLKTGDYISFFVNEKFIHVMESNLLQSLKTVKTNQLNKEIGFSINLQKYE